MNTAAEIKQADDFSLVQGGPLFQLFVRTRLSTNSLGWLKRRIIFLMLLTWLPLFLLSAISGQALSGNIKIPFLYDIETHVRFLIALPLLLIAECVAHRRLKPLVLQFIARDIITPESESRFNACIVSAFRLRNSLWVEIALIVFSLSLANSVWFEQVTLNVTTWLSYGAAAEQRFTPAGYWFAYISLPTYHFLIFRWLFRIFIWSRFLWQVSRLDLHLVATHPDRAGGLGFLAESAMAFMPLILAQGALLAAMIAARIFYEGAQLLAFKIEIIAAIVFLLLLVLGPLCVFSPCLVRSKREGLLQYGALASGYVCEFERKWLQGGAAQDETFIGSSDIQSLADLNNSFEVVRSMRILPFGKEAILKTTVAAVLPVLPLALTMISLEDLIKRLVSVLL